MKYLSKVKSNIFNKVKPYKRKKVHELYQTPKTTSGFLAEIDSTLTPTTCLTTSFFLLPSDDLVMRYLINGADTCIYSTNE